VVCRFELYVQKLRRNGKKGRRKRRKGKRGKRRMRKENRGGRGEMRRRRIRRRKNEEYLTVSINPLKHGTLGPLRAEM